MVIMRLKMKLILLWVLVTIFCVSYFIRNIFSPWSSGQVKHGSERNPIPNVKWPDLDSDCSCRKVNPLDRKCTFAQQINLWSIRYWSWSGSKNHCLHILWQFELQVFCWNCKQCSVNWIILPWVCHETLFQQELHAPWWLNQIMRLILQAPLYGPVRC